MEEHYSQSTLDLLYVSKNYRELRRISGDPDIPMELRIYAAGLFYRPWLPWGMIRKVIFFLLIAMSVAGAFYFHSPMCLLLLLIAVPFSPRIVGGVLFLAGRFRVE
jgi:hypothetical protein